MMEAVSTSDTSVNFYQTTRRNIPEDSHLDTETVSMDGNMYLWIKKTCGTTGSAQQSKRNLFRLPAVSLSMDLRFVLLKDWSLQVANAMALGGHAELGDFGRHFVSPLVGQVILTRLRVVWHTAVMLHIICSIFWCRYYTIALRDADRCNWIGRGVVRLATSRRMSVQLRQKLALILSSLPSHKRRTLTFYLSENPV
jgi:hypothetical protein